MASALVEARSSPRQLEFVLLNAEGCPSSPAIQHQKQSQLHGRPAGLETPNASISAGPATCGKAEHTQDIAGVEIDLPLALGKGGTSGKLQLLPSL